MYIYMYICSCWFVYYINDAFVHFPYHHHYTAGEDVIIPIEESIQKIIHHIFFIVNKHTNCALETTKHKLTICSRFSIHYCEANQWWTYSLSVLHNIIIHTHLLDQPPPPHPTPPLKQGTGKIKITNRRLDDLVASELATLTQVAREALASSPSSSTAYSRPEPSAPHFIYKTKARQ